MRTFWRILAFTLLPACCLAQTGTADCPDWKNKKKSSKAAYLAYLRQNQGKKIKKEDPYVQQTSPQIKNTAAMRQDDNKQAYEFFLKRMSQNAETEASKQQASVQAETIRTTGQSNVSRKREPTENAAPPKEKAAEKKKPSRFERKITRAFTKKTNRAPKANYSKCTTRF